MRRTDLCWNRRYYKHLFGGIREQPGQQELEGPRAQDEGRLRGKLSLETTSNSNTQWPGTKKLDKTGHLKGFKGEKLASRAHQRASVGSQRQPSVH